MLVVGAVSIQTIAWLTPGPVFVIVVHNSLSHGRKSGIMTAVGVFLGNFVHLTYCLTGIALLITTVPLIFNTIKYMGVAYLIYLGIKTITNKRNIEAQISHAE